MNELEKVQKFIEFWFSPWGAAKAERWEAFCGDKPFDDYNAQSIIFNIIMGYDEYNWQEIL